MSFFFVFVGLFVNEVRTLWLGGKAGPPPPPSLPPTPRVSATAGLAGLPAHCCLSAGPSPGRPPPVSSASPLRGLPHQVHARVWTLPPHLP